MSLTSRRRRTLDRTIRSVRDTRLVVIATEGAITEKQYFSMFSRLSPRVHIRILETPGGACAPRSVLDRLRAYREEYELGADDVLCLVIDRDRWPDESLSDVAAQAHNLRFLLSLSNPCFEVWLYLHLSDVSSSMRNRTCRQIESELRTLLPGYNKTNLNLEQFAPYVDTAVQRAKDMDVHPDERWPNQIGSRVYRVIQAIHNLR